MFLQLLVLRELAIQTPAHFFQQVPAFFDSIFIAIRNPDHIIREAAISALRAALAVTASRESNDAQLQTCYNTCFTEAMAGFDEKVPSQKEKLSRDDRVHGALLIINELLRCSNTEGEKIRQDVEGSAFSQVSNLDVSTKYKMFRDWGPASLSKSFKNSHTYLASGNRQRGLSAIVQHHKKVGAAPGKSFQTHRAPCTESPTCKKLIDLNWDKITDLVFRQRNSRNNYVQHVMLILLPRLAAFNPTSFAKVYLDETMIYLLRRDRDRSQAFVAIGLLAIAEKDYIGPRLPEIITLIKSSLLPSGSRARRSGTDAAVFTCIGLIAKAAGTSIKDLLKTLLEPMIATGLSAPLTNSLHELAVQVPQLKKDIQDGLLRMLSVVLMQRPHVHPGGPKNLQQPLPASSEQADESIILALKVLGRFDFQSRPLMQYIRHCSEHYVSHPKKEIRLEAVRTCCQLLIPALTKLSLQYSQSLVVTIQEVLAKLLLVSVTDSEPHVRYLVLASLDERFDEHLAQAENLNALFLCLYDELFVIRELALCSIGRLGTLNPAYVMPSLRKVLLQLLTDLEYSGLSKNKENSAKMLGHLISNAPVLIRPYTEAIIKVFIPKLIDGEANPSVVIAVLGAIGAQAQVSGLEMRRWVDDLFPIILDVIQDTSSLPKREVGMWAFGQLIESTGYVVEPYKKYPNLVNIFFGFLKTEQSFAIRREVIRVLGLLGAVDPYKHKINLGMIDQTGDCLIAMPDSSGENQGKLL